MSELTGILGAAEPTDRRCPTCKSAMAYQLWEASDGGHEDSKYTCTNPRCLAVVWIDGCDS